MTASSEVKVTNYLVTIFQCNECSPGIGSGIATIRQ